MAYGNTQTLYRMAQADPSFDMDQTLIDGSFAERGVACALTYHTANVPVWRRKVGEITGQGRFRGQCANLVQTATNIGKTGWWLQGPKVMGNAEIPPGTAIAAGWVDGHYKSSRHGNTASIFLAHDADGGGFTCLHQWVGDDGGIQPIYIDHMPSAAQNSTRRHPLYYVADMFNVILTVRRINDLNMQNWATA